MTGIFEFTNPRRGMVAVKTNEGYSNRGSRRGAGAPVHGRKLRVGFRPSP